MILCAVSDLHGQLPEIPECDVLIIAGDICPVDNHRPDYQSHWLKTKFNKWLNIIPAKRIIATWGNHDFIGESKNSYLVPKLPWNLLVDSKITIDGINFWGTPHQLPFFDWAFNLTEPELLKKYADIPKNTQVIISHGPPKGYGDLAPAYPTINRFAMENVGSVSLLEKILEINPLLVITGHIHNAYGVYLIPETNIVVANASILNERYKMVNKPLMCQIEEGKLKLF